MVRPNALVSRPEIFRVRIPLRPQSMDFRRWFKLGDDGVDSDSRGAREFDRERRTQKASVGMGDEARKKKEDSFK